ncbi:MAG: enoyl-CoA hydratase/isomerase family protein [Thermoflexaceae bacterium]|nr:enoyl-CoA hydratase/isomerase family protein [Thermoflexaceae bacterium]
MTYQLVTLERDGNVAVLTLNRPDKRNALNTALRDEVRAALEELEADDSVSVAIITGAGPVFCAGFDTSEFATIPPAEVFYGESAVRYHYRLQRFAKPLIAAINGSAMGGGFDIAVLADVRICVEGASFGHPEIKFGASTLYGPLAAVIGGSLARDLCLSGRRIDASEAHRIGLVSQVVAADRLLDEAKAAARVIAEAPLATLKEVKSQIIAAAPTHFPER